MDPMTSARSRIAARRGELRGWRPLAMGDVAVVALQVLGMARDDPGWVGLRAVVAGRTGAAIEQHGRAVAERIMRKRSVLGPDDPFIVEHTGDLHEGNGESEDPIDWPWVGLVLHVPERQLPAIAGLATDTVPNIGQR